MEPFTLETPGKHTLEIVPNPMARCKTLSYLLFTPLGWLQKIKILLHSIFPSLKKNWYTYNTCSHHTYLVLKERTHSIIYDLVLSFQLDWKLGEGRILSFTSSYPQPLTRYPTHCNSSIYFASVGDDNDDRDEENKK